jgi:hypothetical protein
MARQPFKSAMAVVKTQIVAGGHLFSTGPGSFILLLPLADDPGSGDVVIRVVSVRINFLCSCNLHTMEIGRYFFSFAQAPSGSFIVLLPLADQVGVSFRQTQAPVMLLLE